MVISYSAKELEHLATHNLNVRQLKPEKVRLITDVSPQIKNTIRTANALANYDKTSLSIAHIQTVLDIGKNFENDFKGTGVTDNMGSYLQRFLIKRISEYGSFGSHGECLDHLCCM
ncbi:hypothetical protein HYALB_00000662 [Hymenoscyphus albidus]|uniref:Uncharacterized protein n=1 Tax=Hymenoscyphus albidus TaxID=595503 RepID=A0A9N9LPC4_9HELO|nr:hypothetical protein HYALB_00000662 [Hymenoscyphus albidus]